MKVIIKPLNYIIFSLEIVLAVTVILSLNLLIYFAGISAETMISVQLGKVELLFRRCIILKDVQAGLIRRNSNFFNAVLLCFATYIKLLGLFVRGLFVCDLKLDIFFKLIIILHKRNARDRALFFNVIVFINAHNVIVSIWLIKEVIIASFEARWALVLAFSLVVIVGGDGSNHSLQ